MKFVWPLRDIILQRFFSEEVTLIGESEVRQIVVTAHLTVYRTRADSRSESERTAAICYLAGERLSKIRHEYSGASYAMAGASDEHNRILGNIFSALLRPRILCL